MIPRECAGNVSQQFSFSSLKWKSSEAEKAAGRRPQTARPGVLTTSGRGREARDSWDSGLFPRPHAPEPEHASLPCRASPSGSKTPGSRPQPCGDSIAKGREGCGPCQALAYSNRGNAGSGKKLFYTSVSLFLSRLQGYHCHLSKFHIYASGGGLVWAGKVGAPEE